MRPQKPSIKKPLSQELALRDVVERRILLVHGQKVLLDGHLASLYGVETRALIQAVKRNRQRFPADFMFQLSADEQESLRSQIVISSGDGELASRGGRRYLPYVFTEQGVAMLSSVLKSERAVAVNIAIMRTFVRLRQILATHKELAERLLSLERKYDQRFKVVFDALRQLIQPPPDPPKRPIGFLPPAPPSKSKAQGRVRRSAAGA